MQLMTDPREPYKPAVTYNSDADHTEYVLEVGPCVIDWIDDRLTLLRDMDNRTIIGFRLEGRHVDLAAALFDLEKTIPSTGGMKQAYVLALQVAKDIGE